MNKFAAFVKNYYWLIAVAIVIAGTIWLSGVIEEKSFDNKISTQNAESNSAVSEAQNSAAVAANFSIERRSEDAVREKVITPKLETARRRSENSKNELETAKKQYENSKNNRMDTNRSVTDNCAQLARLYPDKKFEYCQP